MDAPISNCEVGPYGLLVHKSEDHVTSSHWNAPDSSWYPIDVAAESNEHTWEGDFLNAQPAYLSPYAGSQNLSLFQTEHPHPGPSSMMSPMHQMSAPISSTALSDGLVISEDPPATGWRYAHLHDFTSSQTQTVDPGWLALCQVVPSTPIPAETTLQHAVNTTDTPLPVVPKTPSTIMPSSTLTTSPIVTDTPDPGHFEPASTSTSPSNVDNAVHLSKIPRPTKKPKSASYLVLPQNIYAALTTNDKFGPQLTMSKDPILESRQIHNSKGSYWVVIFQDKHKLDAHETRAFICDTPANNGKPCNEVCASYRAINRHMGTTKAHWGVNNIPIASANDTSGTLNSNSGSKSRKNKKTVRSHFKCDFDGCSAGFGRKDSLRRHIGDVHGAQLKM